MAGIYRDKDQQLLREPSSVANVVRALNEFLGTTLWQSGAVFSGVRLAVDLNVITTSTNQDLNFTAVEDFDDGDWYDNGASAVNVVVPAGVTRVLIVGQVTWAGNVLGERRLRLEVNGAPVGEHRISVVAATAVYQQVSTIIDVVATDVITFAAFHNVGADLDITQGNFSVTKLG